MLGYSLPWFFHNSLHLGCFPLHLSVSPFVLYSSFSPSVSPPSPLTRYSDVWPWGMWPHSRTMQWRIVYVHEWGQTEIFWTQSRQHMVNTINPLEIKMKSIKFALRSDFKVAEVQCMLLWAGVTFFMVNFSAWWTQIMAALLNQSRVRPSSLWPP